MSVHTAVLVRRQDREDGCLLALLQLAAGTDDLAGARRALHSYGDVQQLLGTWVDGILVGVVGFSTCRDVTTIHHLAVSEGARRTGVARNLVDTLQIRAPGARLEAETDVDAVGFYRRCGFSVSSLGERFPGVERFRVTR